MRFATHSQPTGFVLSETKPTPFFIHTETGNADGRLSGLSLHYYTVRIWKDKGSATKFDNSDYLSTMTKCLDIENIEL